MRNAFLSYGGASNHVPIRAWGVIWNVCIKPTSMALLWLASQSWQHDDLPLYSVNSTLLNSWMSPPFSVLLESHGEFTEFGSMKTEPLSSNVITWSEGAGTSNYLLVTSNNIVIKNPWVLQNFRPKLSFSHGLHSYLILSFNGHISNILLLRIILNVDWFFIMFRKELSIHFAWSLQKEWMSYQRPF